MIDGFRIDVTAQELVAHLDRRVAYHRGRTDACEGKLRQLQSVGPGEEEEALAMCASSRVHGLERMLARHRNREAFLMFARAHVLASEVYRLSENDLRLLEWLPGEETGAMLARL